MKLSIRGEVDDDDERRLCKFSSLLRMTKKTWEAPPNLNLEVAARGPGSELRKAQ